MLVKGATRWVADPDIDFGIHQHLMHPGARPTNDISMEFEIRPKFVVLWFKMYIADHNEILDTSWQCNWRDVCKLSLWSAEHISN